MRTDYHPGDNYSKVLEIYITLGPKKMIGVCAMFKQGGNDVSECCVMVPEQIKMVDMEASQDVCTYNFNGGKKQQLWKKTRPPGSFTR